MSPRELDRLRQLRGAAECPSDLALDRLLAGELDGSADEPALRAHLAGCEACTARVATRTALAARFAAGPPAAVGAPGAPKVVPIARHPRYRSWVGAAGALLAAVAAVLLIVARPPDDGIRLKGGVGLDVVVRHPDGRVEDVLAGDVLSPDDAIRFRLTLRERAFVAVLGLDARRNVSVYWPEGASVRVVPAGRGQLLDGSIILDETLGAERLFAVACARTQAIAPLVALGRRALRRAHDDPEEITGLGSGCAEATFLLRKEARP